MEGARSTSRGDDPDNWTSYSPDGCVPHYYLNDGWHDCQDGSDEDGAVQFEGDLISFNIEVDNDTRTHSNHWHGASLDFSGFTDEFDADKKNIKFRLTDDEY